MLGCYESRDFAENLVHWVEIAIGERCILTIALLLAVHTSGCGSPSNSTSTPASSAHVMLTAGESSVDHKTVIAASFNGDIYSIDTATGHAVQCDAGLCATHEIARLGDRNTFAFSSRHCFAGQQSSYAISSCYSESGDQLLSVAVPDASLVRWCDGMTVITSRPLTKSEQNRGTAPRFITHWTVLPTGLQENWSFPSGDGPPTFIHDVRVIDANRVLVHCSQFDRKLRSSLVLLAQSTGEPLSTTESATTPDVTQTLSTDERIGVFAVFDRNIIELRQLPSLELIASAPALCRPVRVSIDGSGNSIAYGFSEFAVWEIDQNVNEVIDQDVLLSDPSVDDFVRSFECLLFLSHSSTDPQLILGMTGDGRLIRWRKEGETFQRENLVQISVRHRR